MERHLPRDHATSNVLAWSTTHSANVEPSVEGETCAETDEPPDCSIPTSPISTQFRRTPIRLASEHHESLLTKALQSQSDEDAFESESLRRPRRRQSVTSNTSQASTADLTCGTAITTPARTNSPSPRTAAVGFAPLAAAPTTGASQNTASDAAARVKKRCISFACAAKPRSDEKTPTQNVARTDAAPKKTSIKFACPSQPVRTTPKVQQPVPRPRTPVPQGTADTPTGSGQENLRSASTVRSLQSPTPRKTPGSPVSGRNKKWLTADSGDLQSECARFHEFASDEPQEDDWIRRDHSSLQPKLTIDDTLKKENAFRKLGKEAEEEAELEEELEQELDEEEDEEVDEADLIDDDDDEEEEEEDEEDDLHGEDDDDEDEDDEDDQGVYDDADTEHGLTSEGSDGYKTDNETGFAASDDEDDDLVLWTTRIAYFPSPSGARSMTRRLSQGEKSDSSTSSERKSFQSRKKRRPRTRPVGFRPETPELPDSTDFVCGTLDEDKPLEEAYMSCVAARRRDRHQPIPQDIDPSFPTSEPEDEVEELYKKGHGESDDHIWLHGELEDLDHDRDWRGRKTKGGVPSPKRCRSPAPKRRPSPAPKARGRSPWKLTDQRSPRLRSPAPSRGAFKSPILSPLHEAEGVEFKSLALRPGLTHTKSLPRASGMFPHLKTRKSKTGNGTRETHVRGAIDIVKGLEQKRQRRREKYYQKYCSRARKEKAQTKRPPPGEGASRMRELGLIMAGKATQSNYVLSI
ncbi:hypothetical protein VTH06DRAFT_3705 [Thermothelomyces fergusii]